MTIIEIIEAEADRLFPLVEHHNDPAVAHLNIQVIQCRNSFIRGAKLGVELGKEADKFNEATPPPL